MQRFAKDVTFPFRPVHFMFQSSPRAAQAQAIKQAQKYGMYDLARLESMILKQVAGDIFKLGDD